MKLVLIGFMGSGKSTIGRLLAEKLNHNFIDLDDFVLQQSGFASISEIFEKKGENEFRELEKAAVFSVSSKENVVIATGGGCVGNDGNVQNLRAHNGVLIYLQLPFEKIVSRLSASGEGPSDRPLFQDRGAAEDLFVRRLALYEHAADIIINADQRPELIIREIESALLSRREAR